MQIPSLGRKKGALPAGTSSEDAALIRLWMRRLQSAEKHATDVNGRKDRAGKVYLGHTNPDYGKPRDLDNPRDWRSRYYPTIAFEHAELAIAELASDVPEYDAKATLDEFEPYAEAAESAQAYYLERDKFARTYRKAMRRAVKYGGAPIKTIGKVDRDGSWLPTSISLDYKDFFPEPGPTETSDMSWAVHRWRATYEDLCSVEDDEGNQFYDNLEMLKDLTHGSDSTDTKRDNETQEAFEARTIGTHTIYECWTTYGCVAIANRNVVIRNEGTPDEPIFDHRMIPFDVVRIIEDDDNLDGVSLMLQIDDSQEAYWKFVNELINAITLATRPPKLVDEEADPNAAKYEIYPDAQIPARNGEQTVKILQDVANLSPYNMQALITMTRDLIERQTGMNSSVAGNAASRSATEASSNLAQSKGRIEFEMVVSDDDWSLVIGKRWSLIKQFADRPILAKLANGKPINFAPNDLMGNFEFSSTLGGKRALRDQQLNTLMTFWNAVVPVIPPGSVEFEHIEHLLKKMMEISDVPDLGATSKSAAQVGLEQGQVQLQIQAGQQQLQLQGEQQQMAMQNQMQPPAPEPAPAPAPAPPPPGDTHVHVNTGPVQ